METLILIVVLAGLAVLAFAWVLNGMLTHFCPDCHEQGSEANLIPLVPLSRWWCPQCTKVIPHSDVLRRSEDEEPPRL